MIKKPILYILMEIKARELEGKSLLAFEVASRGFRVILGNKNHINWGLKSNALPAGIYFDKSLTRGKEDSFKEIIRRGCLIASQDEESGLLDSSYD
jgi:surface carbohydrate biosynthesis protein